MAQRELRRVLLREGDRVAVVATGFAVRRAALQSGLSRLAAMGLETRLGTSVLARAAYFAGTDDRRLSDLRAALLDPAVRAIWFARGGYGTSRLLHRLDRRWFRGAGKTLVGYSDLTALFAWVDRCSPGTPCLYGPVVAELGRSSTYHEPSLHALLDGRTVQLPWRRSQAMRPGDAEGRLVGGNLTVLTHLLGTRHFPDLRRRVLFLEDGGETAYRLDRMLTQWRSAGVLRGVAGVLIGSFDAAPPDRRFPSDRPVADILRETFEPLEVPVITGLPVGHLPRKWTLPLGGRVRIDARARRIEAWVDRP
jgi:muramoyltetrapeptide carboxypeptidase